MAMGHQGSAAGDGGRLAGPELDLVMFPLTHVTICDLGYRHDVVPHSVVPHSKGIYVIGNDIHTNSVEGFWSQLKRSIDGTYHHVTPQHLQKYAFRYSHRKDERNMFWMMMERVIAMAS